MNKHKKIFKLDDYRNTSWQAPGGGILIMDFSIPDIEFKHYSMPINNIIKMSKHKKMPGKGGGKKR